MGVANIILIYLQLGLPTFKMKLSKYSIGKFYKANPSSIRNPGKYFVHFDLNFLGMNQLLWYYADLEKQKCLEDIDGDSLTDTSTAILQHIGGRKSNKVLQYSAFLRMQLFIIINISRPSMSEMNK